LRARVNAVKSGIAPRDANRLIASPRRSLSCYGRVRAKIIQRDFFAFSRTRALLFLVKKFFGRDENKVSNKVHFFLVDFKSDFYSQARWREKNKNACE